MKMKLIGVLIGIMLMTTLLTVAKPPETIRRDTAKNEPVSTSYTVDVPVWEVGDQWTYKIDNISLNYSQPSQSINLYLDVGELPLEVIDTLGNYYTLTFETTMDGQGHIYTDQGNGPVNISISFTAMKVSGTVLIEKSTLGIKEITTSLDKQKFSFDIIDQPFIQLPSFLKRITTRITMNMTTNCDTPKTMLAFPLSTSMIWNSTATNFSINGKMKCFWFNILNFLNNLAKLMGNEFLPPEVAALLPVIDFKDALTTFIGSNVFHIPTIPNAFLCLNTENITVPEGTYNAYNITLMGGVGQCYYAPTAGNVIKIAGNFGDVLPHIRSINMELLSTNYS
jgi:hypothetical protein